MIVRRLVILGCLPMLFLGCNEEQNAAAVKTSAKVKPAAVLKATQQENADATSEVVQEYVYSPAGKRDPFQSPLNLTQFSASNEELPLTPLQQYEIGQLKLTGVVLGMKVPKAMVKAPDGKAYILNIGTLVGKNGGKVLKIDNEGVWVEEVLQDFSGQTRVNSVLIALPKRKGV